MFSDQTYNPFISPEYLAELHKISILEATQLCDYADSRKVWYKQTYGDGAEVFTEWIHENAKADKAVNELLQPPTPKKTSFIAWIKSKINFL